MSVLSRVMTIGRSNARAQKRATLSRPSLQAGLVGAYAVAPRPIGSALAVGPPRVVVGRVDAHPRHHERRLRLAAVLEHQAGAFDVGAERVLEVDEIGAQPREVHDVREVVGQHRRSRRRRGRPRATSPRPPRARSRVDSARVGGGVATAVNVSLARTAELGEAGDAPHVVLGREVERERASRSCRSRR